MRGDKATVEQQEADKQGSPPHARGQDLLPVMEDVLEGITPACAGTSFMAPSMASCARDHPRMRGDKLWKMCLELPNKGSPPHARGQDGLGGVIVFRGGITPACAGTSYYTFGRRSFARDHPRMRGDKANTQPASFALLGSPPHARGQAPECCRYGA